MNLLDGEVRLEGSAATFVAGAAAANTPSSRAFSIALPPRLAEIARRAAKDGNALAATLGVRPDAVRPAPDGAPDAALREGAATSIAVDLAKAHLFARDDAGVRLA